MLTLYYTLSIYNDPAPRGVQRGVFKAAAVNKIIVLIRAPSRECLLIHRDIITITMNNFQSPLDISINELIRYIAGAIKLDICATMLPNTILQY